MQEFKVTKYNLEDIKILDTHKQTFHIWIPDKKYLILGQSNKPESSLNIERVLSDEVPVLKRPSGGETVILSPETIIVSASINEKKGVKPGDYFKYFNKLIIEGLLNSGIKNLYFKGISDITIGEKKIVGSSIYRSKGVLFYHCVINYNESIDNITKYIAHPKREPDYRKGRKHSDFVTSICNEGYKIDIQSIKNNINTVFQNYYENMEPENLLDF